MFITKQLYGVKRENVMKIKSDFKLVDIADEHMIVPVGRAAVVFDGVVALSDAAYFLIKNMEQSRTKEELVEILLKEYEVSLPVAQKDIDGLIQKLIELDLVEE